MNVEFYFQLLDEVLYGIILKCQHFLDILYKTINQLYLELNESTKNLNCPIDFTSLQWTLLKVLLILILCTVVLIGYFWGIYGVVITEKFVRPSTLKEIEELKLSVAKLKLPKEHTPRI